MPESSDKMTVMHCYNCDIEFWLTTRFVERRQLDYQEFFCPLGHGQHFTEPVKEVVKPQPEAKAPNLFRRVKLQ